MIFGLIEPDYKKSTGLALLRLLVENYRKINSGRGLLYYLKCDFILKREPYYSYLLMRIYLDDQEKMTLTSKQAKKISECGLANEAEKEIEERINIFSSIH